MKVLILTEGGKNIGFGHITRCISLSQAFSEKGIFPKFIVNGDENISGLLNDYWRFNWQEEKERLFKVIEDADIIIIDSYLADKPLYDKISEMKNGRLVMIDDYNRLEYPSGIVVNPSIYGDKLIYQKRDDIIYLLGKDFIILRKGFWDIKDKVINRGIKNILITFGGMDHSKIEKIVNHFKKGFECYFVNPKKEILTAEKMIDLMLKADVCISGGGQTTYELARCGLPTIGICFAENQLGNLKAWSDIGFLEFVGWYNDNELLEKIERCIKALDYKKRLKMNEIGKRCVDGKGAKRVVNEILKYAKN